MLCRNTLGRYIGMTERLSAFGGLNPADLAGNLQLPLHLLAVQMSAEARGNQRNRAQQRQGSRAVNDQVLTHPRRTLPSPYPLTREFHYRKSAATLALRGRRAEWRKTSTTNRRRPSAGLW